MNNIIFPMDFAKKAHDGQKYGDKPYVYHLNQVVQCFCDFSYYIIGDSNANDEENIIDANDEENIMFGIMVTAAWLHDLLEDTNVTYKELRDLFGRNVADLVYAVTDEPGKNRKERKAKTLPKTREYGCLAVAIKLCDRIANVENCIATSNHGLIKMYQKEHDSFKQALYLKEDGLDELWICLNRLIQKSK